MALITPTTTDVNANIIAQLEASLSQTIPLLPKSFLRILAKTLAAVFITLYKYGGWMFFQVFVSTAANESTEVNGKTVNPLVEWGRLIGVGDPVAATQAELVVDITVVSAGTLPSGSQLIGNTNGVTYITIGAVTLVGATVQATVRAVSDQSGGGGAGAIGNLDVGAILSFANPLSSVGREAVVDSQAVTGADGESTEAYRQRVIDFFQKRPQGGAYADYEQWGEETAGIVACYPYTSSNPGQVDVYCEADTAIDPDGIPTTAQLEAVLDNINLDVAGRATRRPANALANTFAITRTGFDVIVSGLSVDNPTQVQSDITDAVEEYFLGREPYILGLTIPPRKDIITATAVGGLIDDIVSAAGGIFTGAVVKEGAATVTQRSLGIGEKAKASSVSFI